MPVHLHRAARAPSDSRCRLFSCPCARCAWLKGRGVFFLFFLFQVRAVCIVWELRDAGGQWWNFILQPRVSRFVNAIYTAICDFLSIFIQCVDKWVWCTPGLIVCKCREYFLNFERLDFTSRVCILHWMSPCTKNSNRLSLVYSLYSLDNYICKIHTNRISPSVKTWQHLIVLRKRQNQR